MAQSILIKKVKQDFVNFYNEIVVENGPRYRQPKEWTHLYVDIHVAFFSMSYTLGHITATLAVIAGILALPRVF